MVGQQDICSSACEGVTKKFITSAITNCSNDLRNDLVSCFDCYTSAGQTPSDDIQSIISSLNSCTTSEPSSPPPSPKPTVSALPLRIQARSSEAEETALPILGAIVGGIIGGVVCLGMLGTVIMCLCRRSQRRDSMIFTSPMALESAVPEMESVGPKITGTNRRQRLSATPWTDPTLAPQRPRPALRRQLTTRTDGIYRHRSDSHLPLLVAGERKLRPSTSQSALSERTSHGPSRQASTEHIGPATYQEPRSASALTFQSSMTSIHPTTPVVAVVPTTPPPYASPYLGSRRRAASAASLRESHDDWSIEIGHAISMREARRKGASVGACASREVMSHRAAEEGSSRDRGVGTSNGSVNELAGSVAMSGGQSQWETNTRARRKLQRPLTPQKQKSVDLF